MPFLLVIGAAYAAYQANAHSDDSKKIRIDPAISVKGKSVVKLHELERDLSILEMPIGTISFFEGDYKQAAAHLERRCEEILKANPWLAGWLLPMPDLQIVYDPNGQDRPPGIFQVFEPGMIPLKCSTHYELHSEMIRDAVVAGNDQLAGQNLPLWRVSVIPDAGEWEGKFAVTVSMSHAAGDAHTYYKIYNMLHCEAKVEALNPIRVAQFNKEIIREVFGRSESIFVENIVTSTVQGKKNPPPPMKPTEVVAKLSFNEALSAGRTPSTKEKSPLLKSFKQHQMEVFAEDNVMKMFYVNEEWVTRRKGRRGSVFEPDMNASNPKASAALTANSIIASWFFRMNDAALGILMLNLRHRLGDRCEIGDTDAGNYVHAMVCSEEDYASPSGLQHVVQTMNRQTSSDQIKLDTNRNSSMCINWANFFHEELKLTEGCHQTVHLPIYNTAILKHLPDKVAALSLFTARCAGNGIKRRAGAFVVCQESVWEKIEESGIVAEMMT